MKKSIILNRNIPSILTSDTSNKEIELTKEFCVNYNEPYLIKKLIFTLFGKFVGEYRSILKWTLICIK